MTKFFMNSRLTSFFFLWLLAFLWICLFKYIFLWGAISTDFIYQQNFNIGFCTLKSDNLIHLTQWQYWWWFWFSFVWGLYYLFINKTIKFRVLKMKPKIATSFRSHGKWGDFLACVVPAIWCYNILVNSSFILRLMEWQNETSLFNVRVRGRQWYWVYKFDLQTVTDIISLPKSVSRNKWIFYNGNNYDLSDDYFYILKLRSQQTTLKNYWVTYLKNLERFNYLTASTICDEFVFDKKKLKAFFTFDAILSESLLNLTKIPGLSDFWEFPAVTTVFFNTIDNTISSGGASQNLTNLKLDTALNFRLDNFFSKIHNQTKLGYLSNSENFFSSFLFTKANFLDTKNLITTQEYTNFFLNSFFFKFETVLVNLNDLKSEPFENTRFIKKNTAEVQPILITKTFDLSKTTNLSAGLLQLFFNETKNVNAKFLADNYYLTLKQKRYKRKKNIPLRTRASKTLDIKNIILKKKFSDQPYISANQILTATNNNTSTLYRTMRKNKIRHESISVQFARRLLRTKKTLVLPAHVNLTIISNSYDVVHSWFLPALGIKIDCVPGRATHHSFYCDSVGFFYGQCAEICGRYHHHMPIRLCSLPIEHFLIWWYHFGLPKLLFTLPKNRFETSYGLKTLYW